MNLQESIRRILREGMNISDIIKITAKEYNCSTWEINNGYCEDFALNVLEKLGDYEDNLFELSGDMFFNQRDPEFAKENWGDVIETNYGVWSKNLLDYWGYPTNVDLNLVDDEINHTWLFYNGKHYDAEVPEGVDNWFEIPLIKRHFNKYKKNMVQESIKRILREGSGKDIMIDRYITLLIKPVDNHKLIREDNKLYIRDNEGRLTAMIYYDKRLDRMVATMNDKLYGMIYDMFSMKDFYEIQKHLIKWFQDNFDGLDDLVEVYTFDDEDYAY